jgi:F-type H+-transporting ATPase subunit a
LMGFIPGLAAPTESINVTGALGVTSFFYYIGMGFRQQGIGYLKHFTGGLTGALLPIGILIFFVEIISNAVRPMTLSLRLFVNMFADHQIGGTFLELAAPLVPIITIVLGLFVAFVQTFIFIMLSMVYLSETVPHEEHDHEEHGHARDAAMAEAH